MRPSRQTSEIITCSLEGRFHYSKKIYRTRKVEYSTGLSQ